MTHHPFRFIHSADLHLELPVSGLTSVPEHLREMVLDAPWEAAQRIFEEALTEKVDFLLLTGDVLSPQQTGAWGPLFLIEQFEKLRVEGIPVYWAGGKADDPADWPDVLTLPENVHRFPIDEIEEVIIQKEGTPIARILGTSLGKIPTAIRPADYPADLDGLYSIGAVYGKPNPETLKGTGMQYWALGGKHRRETITQSPMMIHYPGTTLARSPLDRDEGGATLVEVNEFGRTILRPIKTSPIAWSTERLTIRNEIKEEAILSEMRTRLANLRKTQGNVLLFVQWRLDVPAEQLSEWRYGNLAATLLRDLRSDFGKEAPIIYSLDMEPNIPETFDAALYDQQTILGDFLRITHYYQENSDEAIQLSDFFPEELKIYLENRLTIEKYRAGKLKESGELQEGETLQTPENPNFRSDIPSLIALLSLSQDEQEGYRKTFAEPKGPSDPEIAQRIAAQRKEALKEAGVLGLELLSGQPEEVRRRSAPVVRKNPLIEEERRNALSYLERKENLS